MVCFLTHTGCFCCTTLHGRGKYPRCTQPSCTCGVLRPSMSLGALQLRAWRADAAHWAGPGWRPSTAQRQSAARRPRLSRCSFSTDSCQGNDQPVVKAGTSQVPYHQQCQGGQPPGHQHQALGNSIVQQLAAAAVWLSIIPATVLALGAASGPPAAWQVGPQGISVVAGQQTAAVPHDGMHACSAYQL
jgi:hypothetical protein